MESDIKDYLRDHRVEYTEVTNLHDALPELDAIYVTRMQSEYDTEGESSGVDLTRFSISSDELQRMKLSAVIMHPLPRGPEIHPSVDKDPRSMYWRQERNGMWIRAALIASVLGAADQIREAESRFTTQ
jgi:aspartate carbamoyltransferase catalytic subunit